MVRTPPFHGGDTSSNLVGITNTKTPSLAEGVFVLRLSPKFELVEFGAGSWGARLKEARALRRERGPRREPWEFTISLGSPIQTAGIKTAVFASLRKVLLFYLREQLTFAAAKAWQN